MSILAGIFFHFHCFYNAIWVQSASSATKFTSDVPFVQGSRHTPVWTSRCRQWHCGGSATSISNHCAFLESEKKYFQFWQVSFLPILVTFNFSAISVNPDYAKSLNNRNRCAVTKFLSNAGHSAYVLCQSSLLASLDQQSIAAVISLPDWLQRAYGDSLAGRPTCSSHRSPESRVVSLLKFTAAVGLRLENRISTNFYYPCNQAAKIRLILSSLRFLWSCNSVSPKKCLSVPSTTGVTFYNDPKNLGKVP